MAHYMRFIVTDGELYLDEIEPALKSVDETYRLQVHDEAHARTAEIYRGDQLLGELEVNCSGDDLFDDEVDELLESLGNQEGEGVAVVDPVLRSATGILGLRVLGQGREAGATLADLDPLWRWLHEHREGLLQADGEGYYDEGGLVLATE